MNSIPLDELVPLGTPLTCHDTGVPGGESEWSYGDALTQGGMGRVYELFETRAPFRRAIIKELRPDRNTEEHAAAFKRESDLLQCLAGNGVPLWYGTGTIDGRRYIIIQRGDPVPRGLGIREALPFVDELTNSVAALHRSGYCHGDIKPHNLCLVNGSPRLLDLGSVRKLIPDGSDEPITRTPGYSAPELEEGACAAPWIDVFGMTVTLKEILSPEAKSIYSPAIIDGMDPKKDTRLKTPEILSAAFHTCYDDHRKQKWRTRITRGITHVAVAGIAIVATLVVTADRKERINHKTADSMQCEAASLTELKLGKLALQASNTVEAVESFKRAQAYGESAARILRLIEKTK